MKKFLILNKNRSLLKIYSLDKLGNEFREYLSGIRDLREIEEREKRLSVRTNSSSLIDLERF